MDRGFGLDCILSTQSISYSGEREGRALFFRLPGISWADVGAKNCATSSAWRGSNFANPFIEEVRTKLKKMQ